VTHEQLQDDRWIFTWSGRQFWPFNPQAEDIAIEDIAAALSHLCRFGGHSRYFYSVAQHCVHVADLLEAEGAHVALYGLLHDAPEAYLLDLPRPIKRSRELAPYREAERRIMEAIRDAFDLEPTPPQALGWADEAVLATEVRDVMNEHIASQWVLSTNALPLRIEPWEPEYARCAFLSRFESLITKREAAQLESSGSQAAVR